VYSKNSIAVKTATFEDTAHTSNNEQEYYCEHDDLGVFVYIKDNKLIKSRTWVQDFKIKEYTTSYKPNKTIKYADFEFEPKLEFIWDIDGGRCGLPSTYSKLKEKYEIVEVAMGKGYLVRKSMSDKEILSNFSGPTKFERKELTYYLIWNHDLISYADESKETQEWMDKNIRVFSKKNIAVN
jgi:hypothetical protein